MTEARLTPIRRGDPRTIALTVVDVDGEPVDLSAATWSAVARPRPNSATEQVLTVDVTGADQGILVIRMTGDQSRTFTNRVFGDIQGSTFGTILWWDTVVLSDVTPGDPTGGLVDTITLTLGVAGVTLDEQVRAVLVKAEALDPEQLATAVADYFTENPPDDTALNAHIVDETPHPAYDVDAPSFALWATNQLI